jgi:hypothetical protein
MQETLVHSLRAQVVEIRARWKTLLQAEPVNTPLANPDTLVHLIDWTLKEIFQALTSPSMRRRLCRRSTTADHRHECPCGRNPLLAYFAVGQQAMREALVLAQAAEPSLVPIERDASLEELNLVLQHIARRAFSAFAGVCPHRHDHEPHGAHADRCASASSAMHVAGAG